MKTDLYMKTVLTVIAICLVMIVAGNMGFVTPAVAHSAAPAAGSTVNAGVTYGIVPVNKDGSINVKFPSDQVVDVQIRGIDESPSLRWEAIRIKQ